MAGHDDDKMTSENPAMSSACNENLIFLSWTDYAVTQGIQHAKFFGGTQDSALGRSSLLPPQPHQSVLALLECDQLHRRVCHHVFRSGEVCADRLAGIHGQPPIR